MAKTKQPTFCTDAGAKEDAYNRDGQLAMLKALVRECPSAPLFVALEGAWGSGKSWLIRRCIGSFRTQSTVKFVELKPVLWGNAEGLLLSWLGAISEQTGQKWLNGKRIVAAIKTLTELSPVKVGESYIHDPMTQRKFIVDRLAKASASNKIVLVNDDLDRATKEAIASALRLLMFLVLDEPKLKNVVVLMAYDRRNIEALLRDELGENFIEKFAHVVLTLPALHPKEKAAVLLMKLKMVKTFADEWQILGNSHFNYRDYLRRQIAASAEALRHPRDIVTVVNVLCAVAPHAEREELLLADLVPLLVLQVTAPALYRGLEFDPTPLFDKTIIQVAFGVDNVEKIDGSESQMGVFRKWLTTTYGDCLPAGNESAILKLLTSFVQLRHKLAFFVFQSMEPVKYPMESVVLARRYFRLGPSSQQYSAGEMQELLESAGRDDETLVKEFGRQFPDGRWEELLEELFEHKKKTTEKLPKAMAAMLPALLKVHTESNSLMARGIIEERITALIRVQGAPGVRLLFSAFPVFKAWDFYNQRGLSNRWFGRPDPEEAENQKDQEADRKIIADRFIESIWGQVSYEQFGLYVGKTIDIMGYVLSPHNVQMLFALIEHDYVRTDQEKQGWKKAFQPYPLDSAIIEIIREKARTNPVIGEIFADQLAGKQSPV